MGAIPARPGPILLPSVPYRIGPGRADENASLQYFRFESIFQLTANSDSGFSKALSRSATAVQNGSESLPHHDGPEIAVHLLLLHRAHSPSFFNIAFLSAWAVDGTSWRIFSGWPTIYCILEGPNCVFWTKPWSFF